MSEYTYLGLVNDVNRALNEVELNNSNFSTAIGWYNHAKTSVNMSIDRINREPVEWPFYNVVAELTLEQNTVRYPFPADARKIDFRSFRLKGDEDLGIETTSLFPMDYEDYLTRLSDIENQPELYAGSPTTVIKTNGLFFAIVPPPDLDYTVKYEYYSVPLPLSSSTDVPRIPASERGVILEGALQFAYKFRGDLDASEDSKVRFEEGIKQMRRVYVNNRHDYVRSTFIAR